MSECIDYSTVHLAVDPTVHFVVAPAKLAHYISMGDRPCDAWRPFYINACRLSSESMEVVWSINSYSIVEGRDMYNHSSALFSIVDIKQAMHNTSSLRSKVPKFDFRCTHPRTSRDHNNAFLWGVRRHILKFARMKVGRTWPNRRFSKLHVIPMGENKPKIDDFQPALYKE